MKLKESALHDSFPLGSDLLHVALHVAQVPHGGVGHAVLVLALLLLVLLSDPILSGNVDGGASFLEGAFDSVPDVHEALIVFLIAVLSLMDLGRRLAQSPRQALPR
mmetsp:Transcript_20562/g.19544  ORF Transcript_20562/g.19544 Transcript_20562/m.19544 type:complete len:106 (-) Transcript_20562:1293-1610(-)